MIFGGGITYHRSVTHGTCIGQYLSLIHISLEGSVFVAGASIQWLRDQLRVVDTAPDSEYMATRVKDTAGCYVLPAFTGLGAPYWDQYARGVIVGLTRGCNKYHIVRATVESLAYQVNDVLQAMKADSGIDLAALNVDGGASANNFLMQTQAAVSYTHLDVYKRQDAAHQIVDGRIF